MSWFFFCKGCKILRKSLKQQIIASTSLWPSVWPLMKGSFLSFYLRELQVVVCLTDQIHKLLLDFCLINEQKEISEYFSLMNGFMATTFKKTCNYAHWFARQVGLWRNLGFFLWRLSVKWGDNKGDESWVKCHFVYINWFDESHASQFFA